MNGTTDMPDNNQVHTAHDVDVAPELAALNLADKPDGPGAAAMLAAGIGIFVLGFLTTFAVISTGLHDFLAKWEWGQGVGPLAGKTTIASLAFFASWGALHLAWRDKDIDIKKIFMIGLILGLLGAVGTFPTFFEAFE
jgi:fluoride ion exporter CrcB/FEX